MSLAACFLDLMHEACAGAFAQERSVTRAVALALGGLCSFGRRTLSRAICALGRQLQEWSADYKLFSRSPWQSRPLFDPVLRHYLRAFPEGPIPAALDDTKLRRTGRHVKTAFWQRDPLSPAFHVNLVYGTRFMQTSLLFPHDEQGDFSARAYPVAFSECPAVKKPGKRASAGERAAWREARKKQNLSLQGLEEIRALRERADQLGGAARDIVAAVDGSLCNRTIFREPIARVELIGRCRWDGALCWPAPPGSRCKYSAERFTPKQVREDSTIPWQEARLHYGGAWRTIRYKEVTGVLWRRGAGTRPLRLLVLAPIPYHLSPNSRVNYREPSCQLTTDLQRDAASLLQIFLNRWQIEVNHRDEKEILGVGQAQVWAAKSVPRQPAFAVACDSILLLAALRTFGPGRGEDYGVLPRWRKRARRASVLDILTVLRRDINEASVCDSVHPEMTQNMVNYAYT